MNWSLSCLEKVEQLNFASNQFYGMVPEIVCQLGNLVNLSPSDNYFRHVGPVCRRLIWRAMLDIRRNCIPDLPFQRSVVGCYAFFSHPGFVPTVQHTVSFPCRLD
ncbi:hypothetical protein RJ641_032167 [Dillenia turbinata]|uniref:Uncharacterized protein n=1 Tax=Dillenia turbinata TaxID=194707 RepID=A0AAN8VVR5_9MAGN